MMAYLQHFGIQTQNTRRWGKLFSIYFNQYSTFNIRVFTMSELQVVRAIEGHSSSSKTKLTFNTAQRPDKSTRSALLNSLISRMNKI